MASSTPLHSNQSAHRGVLQKEIRDSGYREHSKELSKGDLKRREILEATVECLSELGFESTSYEAIAQKLQTRRAHIAYYYGSKTELMMAAVRMIVSNYQEILVQHLRSATSDEQSLTHYVEAPFLWAQRFPQQLNTMILFYYLCAIRPEYRSLHEEIRAEGVDRIRFILTNHAGISIADGVIVAKMIQNMITGYLIDAVTTTGKTLPMALSELKSDVQFLVESRKKQERALQ